MTKHVNNTRTPLHLFNLIQAIAAYLPKALIGDISQLTDNETNPGLS